MSIDVITGPANPQPFVIHEFFLKRLLTSYGPNLKRESLTSQTFDVTNAARLKYIYIANKTTRHVLQLSITKC